MKQMTPVKAAVQPEAKFTTGAVTATVWKNKGKGADGKEVEFRTVSLQKRYMDKNEAWQTSNSLNVSDLPKALLVLTKAYEHCSLRVNTETEDQE